MAYKIAMCHKIHNGLIILVYNLQYKCLLLPPIEVIKVQLTADLAGVECRLSCVEVSHMRV